MSHVSYPIYERRKGMTENEIQRETETGERIEDNIVAKHCRLMITRLVMNSKTANGSTIHEYLLDVANVDQFNSETTDT